MKTQLTSENLDEFKKRFGTFHDAVIYDIEYRPVNYSNMPTGVIKLTLTTLDILESSEEAYAYVNLTFDFDRVEQFNLKKPPKYEIGVIFRANIAFYDDKVYVDFYPFTDNPQSPNDFLRPIISKGSILMIVAKQCYWSMESYKKVDDS